MSKRCMFFIMAIFIMAGSLHAQGIPFDQCGTIGASGIEPCGLFYADDGTTYEFAMGTELDTSMVGPRVRVIGSYMPGFSYCMAGHCCIWTTTVVPCGAYKFSECGVLIEGSSPDCWLLDVTDGSLYNVPVGMQGFALGDSVRVIGWANPTDPDTCGGATAVIDATIAWNCCCDGIRGDIDGDGGATPNVNDLTMMVAYLFYIDILDYYNICLEEININGVYGPGDIPFDVNDLTYIVGYLFKGGPPPADCPLWTAP